MVRMAPLRSSVLLLACCFSAPGVVLAQESSQDSHQQVRRCPSCGAVIPDKRCPVCGQAMPSSTAADDKSNADVDRELEKALRHAYGPGSTDEGSQEGPGQRPAPPPPSYVPPPPPEPARDDDEFRVRFRAMADGWGARIWDLNVGSGRNGFPAMNVPIDGSHNSIGNPDWQVIPNFRVALDLGRYVSLEAGGYFTTYSADSFTTRDFAFRNTQFFAGEEIQSDFQVATADLNVVVRPAACSWGSFDLYLGGRYLYTRTVIEDAVTSFGDEQTLEAFVPMGGLGFTLRPIHGDDGTLEIFMRGRGGAIDLTDVHWDESVGDVVHDRFYAVSVSAEAGVSFGFDCIAFTLGYRFEMNELRRKTSSDSFGTDAKKAYWKNDGPFAGVVVTFG